MNRKTRKWLFQASACGPSGAALGDALAHSAGSGQGFGWITWIATASGILTSAAIFRFAARTYLGWGPALPSKPAEPEKITEHPETTSGHQKTPAVMIVPAAVLVLCGLFLAFTPGLGTGLLRAASRFQNHAGYIAGVLDNAPTPAASSIAMPHQEIAHGLINLLLALALAGSYLRWEKGRHSLRAAAKAVQVVRNVHSGHVGDYVVWLAFGFASFGVVALFFLM